MEELTGLRYLQTPEQSERVTVDAASAKALGLTGPVIYGSGHRFSPGTRVADTTGLRASGSLPDGGIGFALRDFGSWRSIYSSCGELTPELWAALFKQAGVHAYAASGDILHASRGCIGLTANSAGTKTCFAACSCPCDRGIQRPGFRPDEPGVVVTRQRADSDFLIALTRS